ncbi:MFS transporter [Fodinicola feengrottensis]|uniref:MFS transporter n=2 Tax=Fodinicola feengrottensis TaxID=435914 RepID=A0ABN2GM09_9ACTN|nr:MFS transporter [Fodinicola feengrottensis]
MWAAEALSQAGDQLARVALSVLVYERTSSAGLTALAYGLTYLPTVLGGTLLGRLADVFPRRGVMVVSDIFRMAVAAAMAIPGMPFVWLCVLLIALTIAGGPARAAQLALLPAVLSGGSEHRRRRGSSAVDRRDDDQNEQLYVAGLAVRNITIQSAQVAGFAVGGLVIALIGPYWALVADAMTFLASALLVWWGVRPRPAPAAGRFRGKHAELQEREVSAQSSCAPGPKSSAWLSWVGAGAVAVWAVPGGAVLFGLKMLAGLYVLPEGLAAPYAAQLGGGSVVIGLLLAADPIGSVVGAWAYARWVPAAWKPQMTGWLAAGAGVPLIGLLARPGVVWSVALIAASGLLSTPYQMQATAMVTRAVPDGVRGQVSGLLSTALVAVQGLGIVVAGAVAQVTGTAATLGCAAVVGAGLGVAGALAWSRVAGAVAQPRTT